LFDQWPFADPPNVAVFTVRQIMIDGHPILRVTHDSDDGAWQFLPWETPSMDDAMLVCLKEVAQLDPSIVELANLPLGWRAIRRSTADPWTREPNPNDGG
jgi:hypothetical protein